MKYLKVIGGLGLIPLGVFAGSFISLGGGSAAILGGVLSVILYCMLCWSSAPHWPGSASLDERYKQWFFISSRPLRTHLSSTQPYPKDRKDDLAKPFSPQPPHGYL